MNGTFGKGCVYNCTAKCPNGEFCNRIDGSCPEGPIDRKFSFKMPSLVCYLHLKMQTCNAF